MLGKESNVVCHKAWIWWQGAQKGGEGREGEGGGRWEQQGVSVEAATWSGVIENERA